ncbi:MAG: MotA/TolQ/ExbB proton channel family protein [Candidatus Omnitrophica bacterium]|nr:MotA/TolQ/ExbB proton channel family protein [Candidatus Omnitrophota bacterium]
MSRYRKGLIFVLAAIFIFSAAAMCLAVDKTGSTGNIQKFIPDPDTVEKGMSLWAIMRAGGIVMVFIAMLSVLTVALVIYFFILISPKKLLPDVLLDEAVYLLKEKRYDEVKALCRGADDLIAPVVLAGLSKMGEEKIAIEEAIQAKAKVLVLELWQKISYLSDIATIAPMLGLLGTVLGMIQAFNVIVFKAGVVKPILLANGIAKAMTNTAAGLTVAIPAMIFYAYFRSIVQNIVSRYEMISAEILSLVAKGGAF